MTTVSRAPILLTARAVVSALRKQADPERARVSQRFFKTGPGQYGAGDRFLGLTVPQTRMIAKQASALPMEHLSQLAASPWHEARLCALLILVHRFAHGEATQQRQCMETYLSLVRAGRVNNWDLVDLSADKILGTWFLDRSKTVLDAFVRSSRLWERRVAVLATFAFIRAGRFEDTFAYADLLLNDPEDLMHKAVGWMLREVGKRDEQALRRFLRTRYTQMPRTMLRYAIERFPKAEYRRYLTGTV